MAGSHEAHSHRFAMTNGVVTGAFNGMAKRVAQIECGPVSLLEGIGLYHVTLYFYGVENQRLEPWKKYLRALCQAPAGGF